MASKEGPKTSKSQSRKETDIADLAPLVAAVLHDRSLHDLVKENERLKQQWRLEVHVKPKNTAKSFHTKIPIWKGYVVNDDDGRHQYLCFDIPPIRTKSGEKVINWFEMWTEFDIRIGGVVGLRDIRKGFDHPMNAKRLKIVAYDQVEKGRDDPEGRVSSYLEIVAVLINVRILPGIMDALGPKVFDNIREMKSLVWTVKDPFGNPIKIDYKGRATKFLGVNTPEN